MVSITHEYNIILKISDDKTEFLLIGTGQQLSNIHYTCTISVGNYNINPSSCARNLGTLFDSKSSMLTLVSKICSASFYHPDNKIIRSIKKYLSCYSLHDCITS